MENDEACARALQEELRVSDLMAHAPQHRFPEDNLQWSLRQGGEQHPVYRIHEALKFCHRVGQLHGQLVKKHGAKNPAFHCIKPVPQASAVTRFLQTLEAFSRHGLSTRDRLGAHHTKQARMESIHKYGLLTRKERAKIGISSPG